MSQTRPPGGRPPLEDRERLRRQRFGAIVRALRGREDQEPFARRISEWTRHPGWTQEKLSKIENGRVPVSLELIEDVAYPNGLSVGWMLLRLYAMPLTPEDPYPAGFEGGNRPMFSSSEEQQQAMQTALFAAAAVAISAKSIELTGTLAHPDVTATIIAMSRMPDRDKGTVRGLARQLAETAVKRKGGSSA